MDFTSVEALGENGAFTRLKERWLSLFREKKTTPLIVAFLHLHIIS